MDKIYVYFGNFFFRQVTRICMAMGTNSAPLLADLFLHTLEYDFLLNTMKKDRQKPSTLATPFDIH